jgi:hypothetical protein
VVAVRNMVQGHYMPTGAPENVIFLEVDGYDAAGRSVLHWVIPFEKKGLVVPHHAHDG